MRNRSVQIEPGFAALARAAPVGSSRDALSGRWVLRSADWLAHPFALVVLHVVALWPVWRWYVRRVTNGSDEP